MEIKRESNENEEQFLWRLGNAKDNGILDLSWDDIADIMNKEFRKDEDEYRTEAAYRKPYQQAKRFFDASVFKSFDNDEYISELRNTKAEIRIEKQKLFDERTALNKTLREKARTEEDLKILEQLIRENGETTLPYLNNTVESSDSDIIICLSDFHLGLDVNNRFGCYDSDIAMDRLALYFEKILEIKETHNVENAYVLLLGDMIDGNIHFTTQLENRENVTEQIQKSAEIISAFIYELSGHFNRVVVNGVAGNHSRISFKDNVLRGERLDNLIPWYMKAKLAHLENVSFVDDDNYDSTIGHIYVRGKEYLFVHGDFDGFSERGVTKLLMMLDLKASDIEAVFYGHLHKCAFDTISNVKILRSGSFSGSVDDYTISKRLSGNPAQLVCVANNNGIKAIYQVELS